MVGNKEGSRGPVSYTHLVAVPVAMPNVFEKIAAEYGGSVLRTKVNPQALMEAAESGVVMLSLIHISIAEKCSLCAASARCCAFALKSGVAR